MGNIFEGAMLRGGSKGVQSVQMHRSENAKYKIQNGTSAQSLLDNSNTFNLALEYKLPIHCLVYVI